MASTDEPREEPTPSPVLEDKVAPFRQPVITATGILLGFILNLASTWVRNESPMAEWLAYVTAACIFIGVIFLMIVLYRVLCMDYPRDKAESYYNRTLDILVAGISFSFLGAFIDLFSNFWVD